MAGNYSALKQTINDNIKQNGQQQITGPVLNSVLNQIVSSIGANATFAGIATPDTNPGAPDQNVFYLATEPGTYANFGGVEVEQGLTVIYNSSGAWRTTEIFKASDEAVADSSALITSGGIYGVINGKTYSFKSTESVSAASSAGIDIFPSLVPGRSYHLVSNVPVNIEYYVIGGSYKHLFDNKSETDFVCPSDYDPGYAQYVINRSGESVVIQLHISDNETGLLSVINNGDQELQEQINETKNDLQSQINSITGIVKKLSSDDYEKIPGVYSSQTGEIVSTEYNWHSSPIELKKGETIYMKTLYQGASPYIVQVDEDGNYIISKVKSKSQVSDGYECSYTAVEDCYVSISYLISGGEYLDVSDLHILTVSLEDNIQRLSEQVDESYTDVSGYSKLDGYINRSGEVIDTTNGWHSSPIELKKGQGIYMATQTIGSDTVIAMTDSSGSFYKPLVFASDKLVNDNGYVCNYYAYSDCFVSVAHSKINGKYTEPNFLRIFDGGINKANIDASNYARENLMSYIRDSIINRRTEMGVSQDLISSIRAADKANIAHANYEYQKMTYEISQCTDDDILVRGTCGYYDNGSGEITDGTIVWKIYKNGILHISGYGKFYDFVKGVSGCMTISQVNDFTEQLGEEFWYYGFIQPNENNIVPYYPTDKYIYEGIHVTYPNAKRYVPFGEEVNPINSRPYGYAAPWYIYRTETDFVEYTSKVDYDARNPNGWQYNRILVEEDMEHGGITYIGDWTFYRCHVDSLILPSQAKYIGCWGVRFSETMRTLVMGDLITTIEDHGLSRMTSLETVKISASLAELGYGAIQADSSLRILEFPDSLTEIKENEFYGDANLVYITLGNITSIPRRALSMTSLCSVDIPNAVTTIGEGVFEATNLKVAHIKENILSIGNLAFSENENLELVIIDSADIAAAFDSTTRLFAKAKYILIKNTLSTAKRIKQEYTYIGDKDGYSIYVINTMLPSLNLININISI